MKRFFKRVSIVTAMTLALTCNIVPAEARSIGDINCFTVKYSNYGEEKYTPFVSKYTDGGNAVVNLKNDSGSAWITANMRNSNGAFRGGCNVQRGKREVFATTGKAGYAYKLGLAKTNNTGGGKVTINGSWSPDEK